MNWTPLQNVPADDFLSLESQKTAAALNKEIDTLLERRTALDATVAENDSADAKNFDFVGATFAQEVRVGIVEALQQELRIRERIIAFFGTRKTDASGAYTRAGAIHQELLADVRKRLVSIGFLEPEAGIPTIGAFTPDMLNRHPEVRNAKLAADSIFDATNDNAAAQANSAACDATIELLEDLKRKLTNVGV